VTCRLFSKLLLLFGAVTLSLSAPAARAQRVAVYDFSTQQPKDRARQPKPFPPGTPLGGKCGGILGNPPVRVSLLSLDKTEYALGDDVVYTVKIVNTGPAPERIAVAFNLADVEPPDPSQSYGYEPMEIWLHLSKPNQSADPPLTLHTVLLTLYGSNDRPNTWFELKTGEWIEVRGRAKLEDTHATGKRILSDSSGISSIKDVNEQITDMKAVATSWRGDIFRFDGRTQYEYWGCRGYEASGGSGFTDPITLLPSTAPK
jgi:hypothetical protein